MFYLIFLEGNTKLSFLLRISKDSEFASTFREELDSFKVKIRKLARRELADFDEDVKFEKELERRARLGPGGLDPLEVIGTLPRVSWDLFEYSL